MDLIYVMCYSLALFVFGRLGDTLSARAYACAGPALAAICFCIFPLCSLLGLTSKVLLILGMALNGLFQSSGYPGSMRLVGNWLGREKKGLVMSLWGSSGNIGNIVGYGLCELILTYWQLSWQVALLVTAWVPFLAAVLMYTLVKEKPPEEQSLVAAPEEEEA